MVLGSHVRSGGYSSTNNNSTRKKRSFHQFAIQQQQQQQQSDESKNFGLSLSDPVEAPLVVSSHVIDTTQQITKDNNTEPYEGNDDERERKKIHLVQESTSTMITTTTTTSSNNDSPFVQRIRQEQKQQQQVELTWDQLNRDVVLHILSYHVLELYMLQDMSCYGKFNSGTTTTSSSKMEEEQEENAAVNEQSQEFVSSEWLLYTTLDLNILYHHEGHYFERPREMIMYFSCSQIHGVRSILAACSVHALNETLPHLLTAGSTTGSNNLATSSVNNEVSRSVSNSIRFQFTVYPVNIFELNTCLMILTQVPNLRLKIIFSEFQEGFQMPSTSEVQEVLFDRKLSGMLSSVKQQLQLHLFLKSQRLLEWFSECGMIDALLPSNVSLYVWLQELPQHKYWPPMCHTSVSIDVKDDMIDQVPLILQSVERARSLSHRPIDTSIDGPSTAVSTFHSHRNDRRLTVKHVIYHSILENKLLQKKFLMDLCRLCNEHNVHKLTTSISLVDSQTSQVLDVTQLNGKYENRFRNGALREMRIKPDMSNEDKWNSPIEAAAQFMCMFPLDTITLYQLDDSSSQSLVKTVQIMTKNKCLVRNVYFKEFRVTHLQLFLALLPDSVHVFFDYKFEDTIDAYDVLTSMKVANCKMHIRLFDAHYDVLDEIYAIPNVVSLEVVDHHENQVLTREYLSSWYCKQAIINQVQTGMNIDNQCTLDTFISSYRTKSDHLIHVLKSTDASTPSNKIM